MSKTSQQYNKVQKFIKETYQEISGSGVVTVVNTPKGFRVGNVSVIDTGSTWTVCNQTGVQIHELNQKRVAIIVAALIHKRRFDKAKHAASLDKTYDIYNKDVKLYDMLLQTRPDNLVYMARLENAKNKADSYKQLLGELEKTADLQ
jgi:hypothetical protein